jgi:hypothetical protein
LVLDSGQRDFDAVFESLLQQRAAALLVGSDPSFTADNKLVELAAHRVTCKLAHRLLRLLTAAFGTEETCQQRQPMSEVWGEADVMETSRLTQLRHGRLKTFVAQKHCSFLR